MTPDSPAPINENAYKVVFSGFGFAHELFQRMADEHKVNFFVQEGRPSCGSGAECPCTTMQQLPYESGMIIIHLNCGGRLFLAEPLYRVYEFENTALPLFEGRFLPDQETVVIDPHGTPVAEIEGGSITLLLDFERQVQMYERILHHILNNAIPIACKEQEAGIIPAPQYIKNVLRVKHSVNEEVQSKTIEAFVAAGRTHIASKIDNIDRIARQLAEESNLHLSRYINAQRALQDRLAEMTLLRDYDFSEQEATIRESIEEALKLPGVLRIDDNGGLCVVTDLITITHENKTYQIGAFRIFLGSGIVIENYANPISGSRYDHPNVSWGTPSLGNIVDPVTELLEANDLVPLLNLLLQFLRRYNPGEALCPIEKWPEIREEGVGES